MDEGPGLLSGYMEPHDVSDFITSCEHLLYPEGERQLAQREHTRAMGEFGNLKVRLGHGVAGEYAPGENTIKK